jgi:2-hydroxy-3-keto-5-methylthiopentenyl-1-phosphate phosphatase
VLTMPAPEFIMVVDFDGTAAEDDVQQAIMDRFADHNTWRAIDCAWAAGEMTTATRAMRQWELIQASEAEILAFLETRRLDPGFRDFIAFCKRVGYPVHVVSDGFDFYIRPLLARAGLGYLPLSANSLCFDAGVARMSFLHQRGRDQYYGNDKTFVIDQLRSPGARIVYAGDGYSDRAAAHAADLLFAKSKLALYCVEHGLPFEPFDTFRDIETYFKRLECGRAEVPALYDVSEGGLRGGG